MFYFLFMALNLDDMVNPNDFVEDDNDCGSAVFSLYSPYIAECKLNDFFEFPGLPAINLIHINCRSMKKNFGNIVNLLSLLSKLLQVISLYRYHALTKSAVVLEFLLMMTFHLSYVQI